jgi:hypothetical protein
MRKTVFRLWRLSWLLATLLSLGLVLAHASDTTITPKKLSTFKEIALPESGWKSIVNETFGFSFQAPASSKIIRHNLDTVFSYEYMRIQNYEFDDSYRPFEKPDRYWLEIFVYDRKADTSAWKSCPQSIREPIMETSQHVKVYRGDCRVREDEGESDREQCLCAETDTIGIWMQGAESNKRKSIQDRIYGSFRFIPKVETQ